jgi:hypothetical protein
MKRALTIAAVADLIILAILLHTSLKDWLWTHPWWHSFLVAVPTIALAVIAFVELRPSVPLRRLRVKLSACLLLRRLHRERSRNRFRSGLYAATRWDRVSVRGLPDGGVRVTKVGEWSSVGV